ncbi:MAG: Methyltransferase type 11 [Myxococcaceae bacterium]|nr:Methyltransferase type 11 [Myxococcaceae bacterium]
MSLGRRKVGLEDAEAWVFNRMADVYDARPPYPVALVDALVELAGQSDARVVDLGAGIGHLALPLALRGLKVTAVEPAIAMLQRLEGEAARLGVAVRALHGKAEAVPLAAGSAELVLIADALHFLDAELSGREVQRLLVPGGALAVVTCAFAETPFMDALTGLMQDAAPRRPRAVLGPLLQLCALAEVPLTETREFYDETPLEGALLERMLRSISFIGPAMNPARFADFCARIHALPPGAWARRFRLQSGRRA